MTQDWMWLSIACMCMAMVFAYFRPTLKKANDSFDRLKNIGLTYFHSICWACISGYCFIQYANLESWFPFGNKLLVGGMVLYFVFVALLLVHRFTRNGRR